MALALRLRLVVLALLPATSLMGMGCGVPLTAEAGRPAPALEAFPPGSVEVERTADDGAVLRGVHIPARSAHTLVLHLMPRGTSSAGHPWLSGFRETLGAIQEEGYASLVMDYRGVGRSDDPLNAEALPVDAKLMLQTAEELGDGAALVIRASSLGTLAWASVANDAPPPAALILAAPIDALTITGNGFRRRFGSLLGPFLSWFYTAPPVPSLHTTLARHAVPTLLLLAEDDALLPDEEREALLRDLPAHVEAHVLPLDHEQLATRLLGFEMGPTGGTMVPDLLPLERRFLEAALKTPQ